MLRYRIFRESLDTTIEEESKDTVLDNVRVICAGYINVSTLIKGALRLLEGDGKLNFVLSLVATFLQNEVSPKPY